jgi:hypothetical protein
VTDNSAVATPKNRYGPITFAVAQVHILIVGALTWFLIPYSVVFVLPGALVYMAISALIAMNQGKIGQVGRGMLIGTASGPLSLLIFAAVWIIAKALGPI